VTATVVYTFLFLAPMASYFFLRINYAELDHEKSVSTFGSLYEGLRNRQSILTWASIQMIRRLILATIIGTLYNYPGLQLLVCLATSLSILLFYF